MNYFGNRIGILGGTFDPIHMGHVAIATGAIKQVRLDRIVFVPAGDPWMKADKPISAKSHRLEMVRLAVKPYKEFEVSDIEIKRPGPTYTVDTLAELKGGPYSNDDIYVIVGIDAALKIQEWYKPRELAQLCELVVAPRGGNQIDQAEHIRQIEINIGKPVHVLNIPHVSVSGTEIRNMIASHAKATGLVSTEVGQYIRKKGLYLEEPYDKGHN